MFFSEWGKETWTFEDTLGHEFLYGKIEVVCRSDGKTGKLKLLEYSCRELLPFSTIFEHDQSPRQTVKLPWEVRHRTGWGDAEVGYYDCGPAPPQLVLATGSCPTDGAVCLPAAAEECAKTEGCQAVAVPISRQGDFQLLSSLTCLPERGSSRVDLGTGDIVRWRSVWEDAPSKASGEVVEPWDLTSAEPTVLVKFPRLDARRVPVNQLEVLRKERAGFTVARKIRQREVFCEALKEAQSCDVDRRGDAVVLFEERGKKMKDCQAACTDKARNSSLARTCCVFHIASGGAAVCALAPGKPFQLAEAHDDGHYPQKQSNTDPSALEAAGPCYQRLCADDPLCTLGGKLEFEAPPNATVPPGGLLLFFDFAHPLSTAFSQLDSEDHASIFHFTSEGEAHPSWGTGRLVRVVGSVVDSRDAKAFVAAAAASRQHTGFMPSRDMMDEATLGAVREHLGKLCRVQGERFHRELLAPRLDVETRDICLRQHGVHSPKFEPCLMEVGCKRLDPEDPRLPFHGPWFSQLPWDLLAWQQPAPMCCASSYNIDHRDENQRKAFFEEIGFQDPNNVDLKGVTDQGAQTMMSRTLHQGAKAMKHLLATEAADPATLAWLAGFVKETSRGMQGFLSDLEDTVDSEGDDGDIEVSADGNSFLQAHGEGDVITPSGRKAFEVARWSEDRGAFLQVAAQNSTLTKAWAVLKLVPGAIYNYGIKPVWKHVLSPLAKWGISISKWVLEHPRAALFITKLALQIRHRLCEEASASLYGHPEVQAVGLFSKIAGTWDKAQEYLSHTFTPAVLLTMLQKALDTSNFMGRLKSLGSAAFGITMSWAGFATGGAATALIGGLASMMADAALDASKLALEYMVYQEIAKEIPANLYNMLFSRCLYKRMPSQSFTIEASAAEVQTAASEAMAQVTEQVTRHGANLLNAMSNFGDFFSEAGHGSILLETPANLSKTGLLRALSRGHEI